MTKNSLYIITILSIVSLIVATYGFVTFQSQLNDLETQLNNLDNELNSINVIEGQLDSIEAQIGEYQEIIAEQQEQISEFEQVTLVDFMGNVVVLDSPPERIVSLAPSNTEILFALGAGEKVVGITDYCNYPHNFTEWIEAGNITSIGSHYSAAVEPTIALEPDLVLGSTVGNQETAVNLKNLGYNVLVLETKTIDGLLQDILLVGRATGNSIQAGELVTEMRSRIDAVVNQVNSANTTPKVYHEVWRDPLMSAGPDTFVDELITLVGGENIFSDALTSWPQISSETVIEKNPDVMFFPDNYMGQGSFDQTIETVKDRPGWNTITAVQENALYEIDGDIISRSAPRLVEALELLAKMIHPEIFGNL